MALFGLFEIRLPNALRHEAPIVEMPSQLPLGILMPFRPS